MRAPSRPRARSPSASPRAPPPGAARAAPARVPSLGTAVRDYTRGLPLLRAAAPLLALCACGAAWAGARRAGGAAAALFLAALAAAALAAAAAYGARRIAHWLPRVVAPCYELGVVAEGAEGAGGAAAAGAAAGAGARGALAPPAAPAPPAPLAPLVPASALPWDRPRLEEAALSALAARGALPRARLRTLFSDRLGNRVFQYVWARARAEHLGVAFESAAPGAPWDASALALAAPAPPRAARCACALARAPSSAYSMDARALAPHDADVARWLRPALDAAARDAAGAAHARGGRGAPWAPGDVAVHVRAGDILWGHHAAYRPLPVSFYRAALAAVAARAGRARPARAVLIAEDPAHALVQRLARALAAEGAADAVDVAPAGGAVGDLASLYTAPAVVLSVSSFCWWPAFLSRAARTVVVPRWGLLRAHAWEPAPRAAPGRTLWHDLTMRRGGLPDSPRGAAAVHVDLDHLPCWGGNTAREWDALFD